ncbi:MAG: DNA-binding transcriptional regulator YiaG, partial [Thalassomonas sp.]
MKSSEIQLLLNQTQERIDSFSALKSVEKPDKGWVNTIRFSIKMSLRQLGERLHISPQGVKDLEKREESGSITLNSLKEVARALDM